MFLQLHVDYIDPVNRTAVLYRDSHEVQGRGFNVTVPADLLCVAAMNDWPSAVRVLVDKSSRPSNCGLDSAEFAAFSAYWVQAAVVSAAWWGSTGALCVLLQAKAAVDSYEPRSRQLTALTAAARQGHVATVRVLLEQKASTEREGYYQGFFCLPLRAAVLEGHVDVVRALLHARARVGNTLAPAARNGHAAIVQLLLQAKARVDDEVGVDPFGEDRSPLGNASANGDGRVVRMLLQANDAVDARHRTPLWRAVRRTGTLAVVHLLMEAKAAVGPLRDSSPLLQAAGVRGNAATVAALLAAKAALNDRERATAFTPLMRAVAAGSGDVVYVLTAAKASLDQDIASGAF